MPRGLTVAQKSALAARVKMPLYFVKFDFASGTVRVWNGVGDVTALSATWKGLGEFGVIRGLETDAGLRATSISLLLAGVPNNVLTPGVVASSRTERYQGRPVTVYFAAGDTATGLPLADPVAIWSGVADVLTFALGENVSAELTCENFASHMRRSNGLRATTESHNGRLGNPSPRDLFFEPTDRLMGAPRPLLEG
jgi:hypothetical protein